MLPALATIVFCQAMEEETSVQKTIEKKDSEKTSFKI